MLNFFIFKGKFIIFGNIQGAFHSLVRDLVQLKTLGIIDTSLKIINPDYAIIFMGDIVSRSAFTMETLSLVMRLMQINPNNVFYLRGNHESANYWQEHTLKTELQMRASHLDNATIPLADKVNAFFDTLPLAFYFSIPSETGKDFIRMSDAGLSQNPLLVEKNYAQFLTTQTSSLPHQPGVSVSYCNVKDGAVIFGDTAVANVSNTLPVNVRIIFKGEKKREVYQPTEGLRLLPPDMGSIAWNILSCPTVVYQKALKFFYDAFIVLAPATRIDGWKITLYNRDVRTQGQFKTTEYPLLPGAETVAIQAPDYEKKL